KIAPALEWSARQPLGANNCGLQHQPASHDALAIAKGPYVQELLAALHAALHHPIERSAVGEFIHPLGDHACGVELFSRLSTPLFVFKGELDPLLKLFGRVTADAKFDHVKRHALPLAEMRDRVNAALTLNHVDGEPAEARLFVALIHVETSLAHGLDCSIE